MAVDPRWRHQGGDPIEQLQWRQELLAVAAGARFRVIVDEVLAVLFPIATRYRNRLMWWDVVCAALGVGLLLKMPPDGSWTHAAWISVTACIGIAALAAGTQKWLLSACSQWKRWALIASGLLLVYPAPAADVIGLGGVALVVGVQSLRRRRVAA